MFASDKQISWLVYNIKSNQELKSIIPEYFEDGVNKTFLRLEKKLGTITKLDASRLIKNIIDENLEGVKRYLSQLY